jgi:hypothetical protein
MIDDLHRIGWKAFQDLCLAIAAAVLNRPVQTFRPSNTHEVDRHRGTLLTADVRGTWEAIGLAASDPSQEVPVAAIFAKQLLAG